MKTIASIFVAILVVYGFITFTQKSPVASFGDGISITPNKTVPTNASSTVTTISTQIVATSTSRNYLIISNDSSNTIYLGIGANAVLGKGIRLATGTSYEMKLDQNMFTAGVWAITTASSNVSYIESTKQ